MQTCSSKGVVTGVVVGAGAGFGAGAGGLEHIPRTLLSLPEQPFSVDENSVLSIIVLFFALN
jgi:hypothetical protein